MRLLWLSRLRFRLRRCASDRRFWRVQEVGKPTLRDSLNTLAAVLLGR
jgi:hypothetical protein